MMLMMVLMLLWSWRSRTMTVEMGSQQRRFGVVVGQRIGSAGVVGGYSDPWYLNVNAVSRGGWGVMQDGQVRRQRSAMGFVI